MSCLGECRGSVVGVGQNSSLPFLSLLSPAQLYVLNYLDRNSPSAARDNGLETDLHLVGAQYQTSSYRF